MKSPPSSPACLVDADDMASSVLPWLLRLRWYAGIGQIVITAVAVLFLKMQLPLPGIALCIVLTFLSNLAFFLCSARMQARAVPWVFGILCWDTLLLTALLFLTGGAHNPFSMFYLLQVALAALLLPGWAVWSLLALAAGGFSALFFSPFELHCTEHTVGIITFDLHLQGMLVALVLCGIFLAYFVEHLRNQLRKVKAQLECAQQRAERSRLAMAMGAFAAGSTHELATPISTIAVAVAELRDRERLNHACSECLEDFHLIQSQVRRCQEILKRLHRESLLAEDSIRSDYIPISQIQAQIIAHFPKEKNRLQFVGFDPDTTIHSVLAKLTTALQSLVKNALQASAPDQFVKIEIEISAESWKIFVRDQGTGMTAECWEHLGEPFFTTRVSGDGSGLGIFLAKMLCESMGVELSFARNHPLGVTATLALRPCS
jgi:two-component system sensor histidine kinase RegB